MAEETVEKAEPKSAPTSEIGLTGLSFTAQGTVDEEFLPQLQGRKGIEAYREMRDNDPVVGAILFAIDMLIRQVEWKTEAGDEDTQDEDIQFVDECLDDMSMTLADLVSEIMSMLVFGFSYHEIVYKQRNGPQDENSKTPSSKYDDGKVGWRKIVIRGQESMDRWQFDDQGGVQALVQKPAPKFDERIIPINKSLLFRTSSHKGNPEGRSVLRNAYRPWFFKKRIEEIEATGIERDLAGLPIAEVPPAILRSDASPEEKAVLAAIQRIVTNIKRDKQEGVVWPAAYDEGGHKLYDLRLLSAGGARQFDTTGIIQRYDQRIAMTVLADFILLGTQRVGSFALSSDKTELFAVALGAWLKTIADTFNRFAIPRLFALNGMDLLHLPKLVPGDIETPPLADLAAYITALAGVGYPLFPNEGLAEYLLKVANLPQPSSDDKEAQQESNAAPQEPATTPIVPPDTQGQDQGPPPAPTRRRMKAVPRRQPVGANGAQADQEQPD